MNRVPKEKSVRMPIGARDSYRGLVDKVVPIGKELEKVPFGFCRVRVRGKKGRRWIPESVRRSAGQGQKASGLGQSEFGKNSERSWLGTRSGLGRLSRN